LTNAPKTYTGEKPFQQMLVGKLDICMQKTETRFMSFTLYKYQNLNIRPETLKLVQERAGNTLELVDIGNDFLYGNQMAQQLRERIGK
jgi:hypothetical protein